MWKRKEAITILNIFFPGYLLNSYNVTTDLNNPFRTTPRTEALQTQCNIEFKSLYYFQIPKSLQYVQVNNIKKC